MQDAFAPGGAGRRPLRDDRVRGRDHLQRVGRARRSSASATCGAADARASRSASSTPRPSSPSRRACAASCRSAATGCSRATTRTRRRPRPRFAARRLAALRRPRHDGRDGMVILHRPHQGHDQGRRRERRARRRSSRTSRRTLAIKLVQVVGVPDERLDEVPAAFVELVAGARPDAPTRSIELLRGPDRRLQGAAPRAIRDRVADVGDQDPEVPPARALVAASWGRLGV